MIMKLKEAKRKTDTIKGFKDDSMLDNDLWGTACLRDTVTRFACKFSLCEDMGPPFQCVCVFFPPSPQRCLVIH